MNAELVQKMLTSFRGNTKRVMKQNDVRGYGILHNGNITEVDLERHLNGDISLALYLLNENECCSTICFDIDIPKIDIPENKNEREKIKVEQFLPEVKKIIQYIKGKYNVPDHSFLVEDTGGRGYHIWLFLENPISAEGIVVFERDVKNNAGFSNLEIFPSNFKNGKTGFSKSLVRLPLGVHRKYNGARSSFLNINDAYKVISRENSYTHLTTISFIKNDVIVKANSIFQEKVEHALKEEIPLVLKQVNTIPRKIVGQVGEMCQLCPALSELIDNAEKNSHLLHHERFALGVILDKFKDGEETFHKILSYCSDYDKEYSQTQINSLIGYNALSCKTLQSEKYKICPNWCNTGFKNSFDIGKSPSPLWFAKLEERKENIQLDNSSIEIIERIASLDNLHHSWQQAKVQLIERDVFEDTLSYKIFDKHLWANLTVIRSILLNKTWKHEPFTLVNVPKSKEEFDTRPSCFSSPVDAIVDLAILNIIGPNIDSLFNKNSLGNRLANSPKIDSEIFIDWRKQNFARELKKQGFSKYDPLAHYIITDIKKFYEFIQHDKLISIVRKYIDDQTVLDIIQQYIEAPWDDLNNAKYEKRKQGIPQGPAFSAFLANLYLHEIDNWISANSLEFVRYVDDIAILFSNKESAIDGLNKLKNKFKDDLSLELSEEKTSEPIPADNIELLKDWLDDARYDIVKSSSPSTSLTFEEKIEFQNALKKVTGIDTGDKKRLTKYLGFYIKFSEKLDDLDIQQGVYTIAIQVLNDERPKHNTTSIAIAALIKACDEFGEPAWEELKKLLDVRTDQYIRIVLCQESRRFLLRTELAELHPKLVKEIYSIAINEKESIASAAALCCIELIKDFNEDTSILYNVSLGKNKYIRFRAILLLFIQGKMNATTLARFIPETVFELQTILFLLEGYPNKNIIDSLSEIIVKIDKSEYSFSSFLYNSIAAKSLIGVKTVMQNNRFTNDIFVSIVYYISKKIIEELIHNTDATRIINEFAVCFNISETNLITKELYKLGKSVLIIGENEQFEALLNSNEKEEGNKLVEKFSLVKKGLTPSRMALPNYNFLQIAKDIEGNEYYNEIISDNELIKIGKKVSDYKKMIDLLNLDRLILIDDYEIKNENGFNYFLVNCKIKTDWKCLADWLNEQNDITIDQILSIIKKATAITQICRAKILKQIGDDSLSPVACTKTLFINLDGDLKFGNISISNSGEKKYFGIEEKINLPNDEWPIFSLGLLFFELRTKNCAIRSLFKNGSFDRDNLKLYNETQGAFFIDIVSKTTYKNPEQRYKMLEHFLVEVNEWGIFEKSVCHPDIPTNRLRKLWQLDVYSDRRVLTSYSKSGGILNLSPSVGIDIIHRMKELLAEEWLKNRYSSIFIKEDNNKHVSTLEAMAIADGISDEIDKYKNTLNLSRTISISNWLKGAAASVEIESLRRSIYFLLHEEKSNIEINEFIILVDAFLNQNRKVLIFTNSLDDEMVTSMNLIENNLSDVNYRLKLYMQEKLPEAYWRLDLLLICFILLVYQDGIKYSSGVNEFFIKKRRLYIPNDIKAIIKNLISVYKNDFHQNTFDPTNEIRIIKHSLSTLTKCLSNNLNVSKQVYRRHNILEKDFHSQLMWTSLEIKLYEHRNKVITVNKSHIPTNFESISYYTNISGCPYSIDFIELKDKSLVPLTFSLPPVARFDAIEKYPKLEKFRFDNTTYKILKYRRKNPITSAFIDFHIISLVIFIALFFIGLKRLTDFENPMQQTLLNLGVYIFAPICFIAYFGLVIKRLLTHYNLNPFVKLLKE